MYVACGNSGSCTRWSPAFWVRELSYVPSALAFRATRVAFSGESRHITENHTIPYHTEPSDDNEDTKPVLIVSCHGTDEKLVETLKKHEDDLHKTNYFKNAAKPIFLYAGANIGSKLSVLKSIALGKREVKQFLVIPIIASAVY